MKDWWKFSADLAMAGFTAQRVVALRLLKLGAGGPAANAEATRMLTEKIAASTEAATTLLAGGSAQKVLRRYGTIIRANERRLTRDKR